MGRRAYGFSSTYFLGPSVQDVLVLPWTRNSDPRSALRRIDTFCRILWHSDLTSSSLQMSLTYARTKLASTSFSLKATHQLENHLLLVQMLQFISRQSLCSANTICCAVLVLYRSQHGIALWVNAEEGRRTVYCINNRFQQSTSLKLVCRDFSTWWIRLGNENNFTGDLWINLHLPDRRGCARSTSRRALLLIHVRWRRNHRHVVVGNSCGRSVDH